MKIDLKKNPKSVFEIKKSEKLEIFAFAELNSETLVSELKVVHSGESGFSRIKVRIVLERESNLDFSGIVKILESAKFSDSNLDIKILKLSKSAKVIAEPVVEVFQNDVKAGHGMSISEFPEREMFYLRSRGVSKNLAENLIKEGFLCFSE